MEDNAAIPHSADGAMVPRLNSALVTRWWWVSEPAGEKLGRFFVSAGRAGEWEWECWPHFNK